MRSWEVNDDAWEAFQNAEDICAGIQAAYEAGIRAAGVAPQPERRATLQQTVHLIKAGAWEPAPTAGQEEQS